jgi:hypothetical protein
MTNLDECVITVPVVGGIFGVGRLATRLKALADTEQIGPWHIGHWIDFKHTAIRIKFRSVADRERARETCTGAASEFSNPPMTFNMIRPPVPSWFELTT